MIAVAWPRLAAIAVAIAAAGAQPLFAQTPLTAAAMYRAWCEVCHAADGSGRLASRPVQTTPIDFSRCSVATPEPDADWDLVIRRGGPAAGLSADMPAFETLTTDQVRALIAHLRSFCAETGWPHGNLNLPRALYTRKAFPENEIVIAPMASHSRRTYTTLALQADLERRLGRRAHAEISVPFWSVRYPNATSTGIGDLSFGGKYVLLSDPARPLIVTAGAEISVPTGSRSDGFGEGTTVVEPFVAAATVWRRLYLQGHVGVERQAPRLEHEPRALLRFAGSASTDLSELPSTWTVGVEVDGSERSIAIVPQLRKGLTRDGLWAAGFGVRVPVANRYPFTDDVYTWRAYLLWEMKPGGSLRFW